MEGSGPGARLLGRPVRSLGPGSPQPAAAAAPVPRPSLAWTPGTPPKEEREGVKTPAHTTRGCLPVLTPPFIS